MNCLQDSTNAVQCMMLVTQMECGGTEATLYIHTSCFFCNCATMKKKDSDYFTYTSGNKCFRFPVKKFKVNAQFKIC